MTTHADLLNVAAERLQATSASPRLDAEILLRTVTGLDRTRLFLALRDDVQPNDESAFQRLLERRENGEPTAYITGAREFMGLPFAVTPDVLVPRPETELLVEWALSHLPAFDRRPVRLVDIGSGSGAIAVAIAALAPVPVDVTAVEPSPGARDVISRNAAQHLPPDRPGRFAIVDGDLLDAAPGPFDIVLANLPYLTPEQIAENPDLAAEPRLALDGGVDGLDLIRRLIPRLPARLAQPFAVGLELDPMQAEIVSALLASTLPGAEVAIIRDYAGFDRHVVSTRFES